MSVCAYCGQTEGHSQRCSVTKFDVKETRLPTMTRAERIEQAARVAMHWFAPIEGEHPEDPDLDPEDVYELLREALQPDQPPPLQEAA
jgi:sulfatase maturation enzyme AslB (radical SAM superfamily)